MPESDDSEGLVTQAVARDIARLSPAEQQSAMARIAYVLAQRLDAGAGQQTSQIARELRIVMSALMSGIEPEAGDSVDDLAARRAARRTAASGTP